MAKNDPTDTGGLFIGRRPGTAPLRLRERPGEGASSRQRRRDRALAAAILVVETALLVSLWGPQPAAWLWVGSQANYLTDNVVVGITVAFVGMMVTLFLTLVVAKRLDHMWRLVRRAAGYAQKEGILERIFVISIMIAVSCFLVWFLILEGPGSTFFPKNAP